MEELRQQESELSENWDGDGRRELGSGEGVGQPSIMTSWIGLCRTSINAQRNDNFQCLQGVHLDLATLLRNGYSKFGVNQLKVDGNTALHLAISYKRADNDFILSRQRRSLWETQLTRNFRSRSLRNDLAINVTTGPLGKLLSVQYEYLYSPNKYGRRVNNTNTIKTTQLQIRQKTLKARFKFRHTFGP